MSARPYLDGQPSVVTVDGDAVGDIGEATITRAATNDNARVNANPWAVDGGNVEKTSTAELSIREGTTNATTGAHPERFFAAGEALAGDLVITYPARGDVVTGLSKTATMACVRVSNYAERNQSRRLVAGISLDLLSVDGTTDPVAVTWA